MRAIGVFFLSILALCGAQLRASEDSRFSATAEINVDAEKGMDARSIYERNLELSQQAEDGIYKGMNAYHSYTKKSGFLNGPGGAPKYVNTPFFWLSTRCTSSMYICVCVSSCDDE